MKSISLPTITTSTLLLSALVFAPACGDDGDDQSADDAHLMFGIAPPTALTAGTPVDVMWEVHTEGDLHHTEIRACMGHSNDCGLGDATSFDENFAATPVTDGEGFTSTITIDVEGPWTIAVFAHVGETPHISDVIHATVSP